MAIMAHISGSSWNGTTLLYDIEVDHDGCQWTARRRYTDFVELDKRILASGEMGPLGGNGIPGKGSFGLRHYLDLGGFNERRQVGLELYLEYLMQQVRWSLQNGPAGRSSVYNSYVLPSFLGLPLACCTEEGQAE